MGKTIKVADLDRYMQNLLGEYDEHVQEVLREEALKCGRWATRRLRSTSPKNSGDYAKDWTCKKTGKGAKGVNSGGVIVYNREHYQLTHLLEKGHVSIGRIGKNEYGVTKIKRVQAYPHIEKVEKAVAERYTREVLSKI